MRLRVGTRGSLLATTQSSRVVRSLEPLGHDCELVTISTLGDQVTDRPFAEVGPPGVFVREIEKALLDGEIDLAVHSYKDLPTTSPEGLLIGAVAERLDPADVLVIDKRYLLEGGQQSLPLAPRARVGTSSSRRSALLIDLRPDLDIVPLRGNVPTRLAKCRDEEMAAIILAASGIERLGSATDVQMQGLYIQRLRPDLFVPAPSQGALAVQVRNDSAALTAVAELDQPRARLSAQTERDVLSGLEGGCQTAIGAWLSWSEDRCTLYGVMEHSGALHRSTAVGNQEQLPRLIAQVIEELAP